MPGTIYPPKKMFLRAEAGSCKSNDGYSFELATGATTGAPIVRCKETGKWFVLSWTDIVDLAIEAGIITADKALEAKK